MQANLVVRALAALAQEHRLAAYRLLVQAGAEGIPAGVLAEALGVDLEPSTITPLVKRLEQAGHVARRRNPADERQVKVALTDRGRALRMDTRSLAEALYSKSGLTAAEVADLNTRVTALRDAFRTT
jgi:DNA-binding MarR family transcriptional regulator